MISNKVLEHDMSVLRNFYSKGVFGAYKIAQSMTDYIIFRSVHARH
jgi:hypothetical protein